MTATALKYWNEYLRENYYCVTLHIEHALFGSRTAFEYSVDGLPFLLCSESAAENEETLAFVDFDLFIFYSE